MARDPVPVPVVETVRLTPEASLVPEPLLTPPFREDSRGLMRDLAALLLDRHLRRLARMRNPVDLRIGRLLEHLDTVPGYLDLGFARLTDYAAERLGLPARRARALVAMSRGLARLPQIAAAYEAGRISHSQVLLLLRVATPDTEADWLSRALSRNVRLLERDVRAAASRADGDGSSCGVDDPGVKRGDRGADRGVDREAGDGETSSAGATHSRLVDDPGIAQAADDESTSLGEWIDIPVPGRLRPLWDQAVELARRSSGSADPVWRCVEFIAADFLAGVPDLAGAMAWSIGPDAAEAAGGVDPQGRAGTGVGIGAAIGAGARPDVAAEETDLFEEVLRALEEDTGARRWAPGVEGLTVLLPPAAEPGPDDTPATLDRRLRELVRLRQNIAWHQGRLLRIFAGRRLHRELGFLSFSRYCRERAGLGVRRAWELIALERRLWLLPRVAEAYRSGALSWVRAAAIARVASEPTEEAWLHLAFSVTVRRLIEEVDLARRCDNPPFGPPAGPPGLDARGRVQLSSPGARAGAGGAGRDISAATGGAPPEECPSANIGAPHTRWSRLRFWAPNDVAALWHHAVKVSGAALTETTGEVVRPAAWHCVEKILSAFLESWSLRSDPAWRRRYRIFERDGWRCRVPGCSSRENLQVHHVVFRSLGGGDEDANLAVLCATHHLQGIHRGRLVCHSLPEGLLAWEFAPDPPDEPLARFVEDVEWSAARQSLQPAGAETEPAAAIREDPHTRTILAESSRATTPATAAS